MAKISIIVPVYKSAKYLSECVDSILKQTFQDFELILVDDGSPDDCPEICDEYEKKDDRVIVIHQKNAGAAAARNAGLEIASGDYIGFVDSDDYIEPYMYERMIHKANKYNCDLIVCDCLKENKTTSAIYTHEVQGGYYDSKEYKEKYFPILLILPNIEYPLTISNWACIVKRDVLIRGNIRYQEGIRFSEDWLFGSLVALYSENLYYMKSEYLYHYRMNEDSVTHTFRLDKWEHYKKLYSYFQLFFGEYKEFDFENQIFQVLLFLIYNAIGDIFTIKEISIKRKKEYIKNILWDKDVREMFQKIDVPSLKIAMKLKVQTLMYKYRCGIGLLCLYYSKKGR